MSFFWNLYGPEYKRFISVLGWVHYGHKMGNSMWTPNMGPNVGSNAVQNMVLWVYAIFDIWKGAKKGPFKGVLSGDLSGPDY